MISCCFCCCLTFFPRWMWLDVGFYNQMMFSICKRNSLDSKLSIPTWYNSLFFASCFILRLDMKRENSSVFFKLKSLSPEKHHCSMSVKYAYFWKICSDVGKFFCAVFAKHLGRDADARRYGVNAQLTPQTMGDFYFWVDFE